MYSQNNHVCVDYTSGTFGDFLRYLISLHDGFEKFDDVYVRIDMLERLFLLIFNSEKDYKKEIKVTPEMLNLLGCSKENFNKLLKKMNYKIYEKKNEFYIKYIPLKKKIFKKHDKKDYSNNPFSVLNELNIK